MSVEEKVTEVVAKNIRKLDVDLHPETLLDNLDANYLDIVEMVSALEDYYDIEVSDEELQMVKKVGDLIACVKRKVAIRDLITQVEQGIVEGNDK